MSTEIDFWAGDDFEDAVASTLVACYETEIHPQKGAFTADRLNERVIESVRRNGPYIPGESRLFQYDGGPDGFFDTRSCRLPVSGVIASPLGYLPSDSGLRGSLPGAYLMMFYFRMADRLSRPWVRRAGGQLYELYSIWAKADGLHGERDFFSVTSAGDVVACQQVVKPKPPRRRGCFLPIALSTPEEQLRQHALWGSVALQAIADRRFCWTISAREGAVKARLGCMQEEVKSLLYARDLPLTATGRKRPILHLVEAHKRRIRNGTDVDVTAFLRGQQVVEIGGTEFKVSPPSVMRPVVSKKSAETYFDPAETPL